MQARKLEIKRIYRLKINLIIMYRIFVSVNYADTCRDRDDIHITELCCKKQLPDAKKIAEKYIKNEFIRTDTKLFENKDGSFSATDFCSYGETITIQPIIADESKDDGSIDNWLDGRQTLTVWNIWRSWKII